MEPLTAGIIGFVAGGVLGFVVGIVAGIAVGGIEPLEIVELVG
ncbi:MAG: hypothetical protein ABEJ78_01055 [Haloferacaceae archaeon]